MKKQLMNSSVIDTVNDLSDIQYDYNVPIAKTIRLEGTKDEFLRHP